MLQAREIEHTRLRARRRWRAAVNQVKQSLARRAETKPDEGEGFAGKLLSKQSASNDVDGEEEEIQMTVEERQMYIDMASRPMKVSQNDQLRRCEAFMREIDDLTKEIADHNPRRLADHASPRSNAANLPKEQQGHAHAKQELLTLGRSLSNTPCTKEAEGQRRLADIKEEDEGHGAFA